MDLQKRKKSSLRQSLGSAISKKSFVGLRSKADDRLRGRYLFRAVVRLVLLYKKWLTEEPSTEEIVDDVTIQIRMAQEKKGEKKFLTRQDRSILLTRVKDRSSKDKSHIFDLFKKLHAFQKHSEDIRKLLAEICDYQYLPSGRVIVRQGYPAENLYFIIKGEVSLSRTVVDAWTDEKTEIGMGILNPGDVFGEVTLLYDIPRTATIISISTVDLLLICRDDFNRILRAPLEKEWNKLQDALVNFNYFKSWDSDTIRECCILSRLIDFEPDEVLLGDGKGMVNYVHFLLDGRCRLIEHMHVRERIYGDTTRYELYDQDKLSLISIKDAKQSLQKIEMLEKKPKESKVKVNNRISRHELLASKEYEKRDDLERTSITTATLLDVVNEWHEITEVAEMLMREPSTISQQCYPNDVRTIFMQICLFSRGACFGLGENMVNRRIVSISSGRCFLIPRHWLRNHNRANIWERVKLFMDSKYPSRQQLFQEFVRNRKWTKYREGLVEDIRNTGRKLRTNVSIHDVPYSTRINDTN